MSALSVTSVDQLRRLEALSGLVSTMLGTLLLVRAEEREALVRRCACVADGIARDLAQLDGGRAVIWLNRIRYAVLTAWAVKCVIGSAAYLYRWAVS